MSDAIQSAAEFERWINFRRYDDIARSIRTYIPLRYDRWDHVDTETTGIVVSFCLKIGNTIVYVYFSDVCPLAHWHPGVSMKELVTGCASRIRQTFMNAEYDARIRAFPVPKGIAQRFKKGR